MIKVYSSIIEYNGNEWSDYLDNILLYDIFKPLFEAYPDIEVFKCVVKYIAYAYSVDSDKVQIGSDWLENKKQIYEFVCAKPVRDLYEDLVHLKNPFVLKVVHNWLEHQELSTFKTMQSLKDLKIEMQLSSNSKILKANGEVDYTQKFLNAGYVTELTKMIRDLESELIQNSPKLKEAIREVSKTKAEKNSRSVGSYAI